MDNLLKAVQNVVEVATKSMVDVKVLIVDYNKAMDKLAQDKEDAIACSKDLDAREVEIKKVEDVQGLKQEADEQLKKASAEFSKLGKERDTFNDYVSNTNRELSIAVKKNAEETRQQKTEWDVLKKDRVAFEKEKANYQIKIAEGLVKLAGK